MKKSVFITVLIALFTLKFAQAGGAGGFGMKGGINASTIALENESASDQKDKYRLGIMGGFSYEIATPKFFAVDIELLYSLVGNNLKYEIPAGKGRWETYFHYVNVPVSTKFYIGSIFNLYVGGFAGFAAGGQFRNVFDPNIGTRTVTEENLFSKDLQDVDGEDLFNRLNAGVLGGFELVSKKGHGAGFRFTQGLTSVNNTDHVLVPKKSRTTEVGVYGIVRLGK